MGFSTAYVGERGGDRLRELVLAQTPLCVTAFGHYSADAVQTVCEMLTAPGNRIRKLDLATLAVSTLAGSGESGNADGPAADAPYAADGEGEGDWWPSSGYHAPEVLTLDGEPSDGESSDGEPKRKRGRAAGAGDRVAKGKVRRTSAKQIEEPLGVVRETDRIRNEMLRKILMPRRSG